MSRETVRVAGESEAVGEPHLAWKGLPGGEELALGSLGPSQPQGFLKHLLYVSAGQHGPTESRTLPTRGWGLRGQREDGCRAPLLLISGLLPALPSAL